MPGVAITTPDEIQFFSVRVLIKAIELEILGVTKRGESAYSIAKRKFGLKGDRKKVKEQLEAMCNVNQDD
jgi:hypothetical protein